MSKQRSFSIYLLKDKVNPYNALKENHGLELITDEKNKKIYIVNSSEKEPWWKDYWGINKRLNQTFQGAIVFLQVGEKWVALAFGNGYHKLKATEYEEEFGIITTLNALDPEKIKSLDAMQPDSAKKQRIQSPKHSNLFQFGITGNENTIQSMTGHVKSKYENLFKNITGGNTLRISTNVDASQMTDLCSKIIEIYGKEDYKTNFPSYLNVKAVKKRIIIDKLDSKLIEAIHNKQDNLSLSFPEIIDYASDYSFTYSGFKNDIGECLEVDIKDYFSNFDDEVIKTIDFDTIKNKHKLEFSGPAYNKSSYSIYKCLLFDCKLENTTYHLFNGEWYSVNDDFIKNIEEELDEYFIPRHNILIECNKAKEEDYNISVEEHYIEEKEKDNNRDKDKNKTKKVICLDKKHINPNGTTQVEPCDLIYIEDNYLELAHIKVGAESNKLSHLFNQGLNSLKLLKQEKESKEKLINLTCDNPEMMYYINNNKYKITYGIIADSKGKKQQDFHCFLKFLFIEL